MIPCIRLCKTAPRRLIRITDFYDDMRRRSKCLSGKGVTGIESSGRAKGVSD